MQRNHGEILDDDEIVSILDDGYRCLRQFTENNNRLQGLVIFSKLFLVAGRYCTIKRKFSE